MTPTTTIAATPCSAQVRYCSKEHQLAAWNAGHKATCGQGPPTLVGVAQAPNAAAVLSVLSEFGATPAHDGLVQTAASESQRVCRSD